ncbi:MAG: PD-(D/E)XK nuclease family protein [Gaiellales bacterium]|nr:PD-(D/E)XK nuclease family protein [Gaiellales bacterium]
MPLTLVLGPANCGKVALLLDRFRTAVAAGQSPFLIVPTRPDVAVYERELLQGSSGVVLRGTIGTFDDLFEVVLDRCRQPGDPVGPLERRAVLEEAMRRVQLQLLAPSARFPGFAEGLGRLFDELAAGGLPDEVERRVAAWGDEGRRGEITALRAAMLELFAELGLADRAAVRGRAAALLAGDLEAWDGDPVLVYGFEDLTGVQLEAIRALAGRSDVTVSLPYETGRDAFTAVRPAVDRLAAIATDTVELPPRAHVHSPVLAQLERSLFAGQPPAASPEPDGSLVLLEACGRRGAADQVAAEVLELIRGGLAADQVGVLVPEVEPWRLVLETSFAAHGLPLEVDALVLLPQTPFGQALIGLLRFAWFGGDRSPLFGYLRSAFSGVPRRTVDWAEGRLRGRGMATAEDVRRTLEELDYARLLAAADRLADAADPLPALRATVRDMAASAFGLDARPQPAAAEAHLRAVRAVLQTLDQLERLASLGVGAADRAAIGDHLSRVTVRLGGDGAPGRVAVLDLRRARTRRFEAAFVLGLEEGSLPRGAIENPYLGPEEDAALGIVRLDPGDRDRHLFYTAVTRPWSKLFLCRQAADEEGRLREPSPFLEEVRRALPGLTLPVRRRALGDITWMLEDAPTDRERQRALARALRDRPEWAAATGEPLGWGRKLERARTAYRRRTELRHPAVLAALAGQERFSVTELEKFADCSSAWFVERFLSPGEIDYEFGAKERGSVAHTALHRFFDALPRELGVDHLRRQDLPRAYPLMARCLADALATARVPLTPGGKEVVRGLERDLAGFLRREVDFESPLVPRRFEVRFGTKSSPPELNGGLRLDGFAVSGTIDRVDMDPSMSARGMVWDYKTGRDVPTAANIDKAQRLQIPLYIMALRDLLGVEPVAGLYRGLGGKREARGMAVKGEIGGIAANDQLAAEDFWDQVDRAVVRAERIVGRIRAGDVKHDPQGGSCPEWCVRRVGGICRVGR